MEILLIFHVAINRAYGGLSFIQEELKPKKKKRDEYTVIVRLHGAWHRYVFVPE